MENINSSSLSWGRSYWLAAKSIAVGFLFSLGIIAVYLITVFFIEIKPYLDYYTWYSHFYYGGLDANTFIAIVLLNSLLSILLPVFPISFNPWNLDTPINIGFPIFSGFYEEISMILIKVIFSVLIQICFLLPIIKYAINEVGINVSWRRSFITAGKSFIVGIILGILCILGLIAFSIPIIFGIGAASADLWRNPAAAINVIIVAVIVLLFIGIAVIAVIEAPIIKFTTAEALKKTSASWIRSFIVSLKAVIVGILLSLGFIVLAGIIFFLIFWGSLTSGSLTGTIAGALIGFIAFLILCIPAILSPTASLIKYTVEEIISLRKTLGQIPT